MFIKILLIVLFSDVGPFDTQSTPSPSSSASRQAAPESDRATREFIDFLKPVKSGREIFKQCRAFTESMAYKRVSFDPSRQPVYYFCFSSSCVHDRIYTITQTALEEGEVLIY